MPALGASVSFSSGGRTLPGTFVLEEKGRCLIVVPKEIPHSTALEVETGRKEFVTWVVTRHIRFGVLAPTEENYATARLVLMVYLASSPEVFESPAEEENTPPLCSSAAAAGDRGDAARRGPSGAEPTQAR